MDVAKPGKPQQWLVCSSTGHLVSPRAFTAEHGQLSAAAPPYRPYPARMRPSIPRLLTHARSSAAGNVAEASAGIEPACRSFADWYLTTRSRDPLRPRPDSNGRPAPSEGAALSNCATRTGVGRDGIEPPIHKATVLPTAALPLCHRPVGCLSGVEPLLPEPQSGAFPRRQQAPVGDQGLEPRTDGM